MLRTTITVNSGMNRRAPRRIPNPVNSGKKLWRNVKNKVSSFGGFARNRMQTKTGSSRRNSRRQTNDFDL